MHELRPTQRQLSMDNANCLEKKGRHFCALIVGALSMQSVTRDITGDLQTLFNLRKIIVFILEFVFQYTHGEIHLFIHIYINTHVKVCVSKQFNLLNSLLDDL
jgi:hypothetical protein